jgi:uncharacterized membrane protein
VSERRLSLDALRGLAVLLMIEQHVGVWLWTGPERGKDVFDYPVLVAFNALGGGAAPLFILLAGVGSALLIQKRPSPDRTLVLRGLTVMGFGYLLSLATPSWFTWRSWFVLHLMGFGIALAPLFRRLPTKALWGLVVLLLVATPFVQEWLQTPGELSNPRMAGWADGRPGSGDVVAGGHLRLALAESQFPILPWLSIYVAGLACGRLIVEKKLREIRGVAITCLVLGGGMALLWFGGLRSNRLDVLERALRLNVPFFPASAVEVLLLLGVGTLALYVGQIVERRVQLSERGVLVVLGRASLTLLLLHVFLFREVSRPLDLWQSLSPGYALSWMIGFVVVAAIACRMWQRTRYRFGAEWLLRKLAP